MKIQFPTYIVSFLFLVCFTNIIDAQQDPQYTQYMYNTLSFNPAYAGSRGEFSAIAMYRTQWVGLDGAPETQVLNAHGTFKGEGRLGYGLSIINETIGPTRETFFGIDISYTIPMTYNSKLAFGIKGGGNVLDVNFQELLVNNPNDVTLNDVNNRVSPNVGAGIFYNYDDRFYLGVSVPALLESDHFDESTLSEVRERINYYLIAGYVFDLNPNLKLKPAVLAKAVSGAPFALDMSANLLFNDRFTLGAAYRLDVAMSALAGFQISNGILLGVAYDWETSSLGQTEFNNGSYEFFLRFELFNKNVPQINPRFF